MAPEEKFALAITQAAHVAEGLYSLLTQYADDVGAKGDVLAGIRDSIEALEDTTKILRQI